MWIARKRYEELTKIESTCNILIEYIGAAPFAAAEVVRVSRSTEETPTNTPVALILLELLRTHFNRGAYLK